LTGSILVLAFLAADDSAAADRVVGAQTQKGHQVCLGGKSSHVLTDFCHHRLGGSHVDAIDRRQVDTARAVQLPPQIEIGDVAVRAFVTRNFRQPLGICFHFHGLVMTLQFLIAFARTAVPAANSPPGFWPPPLAWP
jgi:hypothetical protein